jgi:hypothetical protein
MLYIHAECGILSEIPHCRLTLYNSQAYTFLPIYLHCPYCLLTCLWFCIHLANYAAVVLIMLCFHYMLVPIVPADTLKTKDNLQNTEDVAL